VREMVHLFSSVFVFESDTAGDAVKSIEVIDCLVAVQIVA
jgi:hypothetical protein